MNVAVLAINKEFFFNFAEANHMRIKRISMQAEDDKGNVYIYCPRKDRMYGIKFGKMKIIGDVPNELKSFARTMVRD